MTSFIDAICGLFGGEYYQIRTAAKRLCSNILLSMNNGDKFYSFEQDDFLGTFPSCAIIIPQRDVINSTYFQNFVRQTNIIVGNYKGRVTIDYPNDVSSASARPL